VTSLSIAPEAFWKNGKVVDAPAPLKPASGRVHARNGCAVLELEATRRVSYCIINTEQPIFELTSSSLANLIGDRQTLAVVDKRIMERYGIALSAYLENRSNLAACITLAGGERAKRWRSVERICSAALECHLERSGVMVAVGGGTVMDLVGVAASLYRRGIDYVRVPTTLIGVVDVAAGIKTAFNFREKKNALGALHAPIGAVADRRFLQTLPRRHLAGGIAEILKMGIICDERLFGLIETHGPRLLQTKLREPEEVAKEVILRAQARMMDELEPNLFEDDKRRLVDFGHTISPLLEAESRYRIHHGEAVALDMLFSSALSATVGLCDYWLYARLRSLYERVGLPTRSCMIDARLVARAFEDARRHRGQLNLVVPTRVGRTAFVQTVREEDIAAALQLLQ
jgi:2-epi-5-epi-valiolone synthase